MTMQIKPYWMVEPSNKVKKRLEKIQKVGSIERTVRKITYILYPKLHGKDLENAYNTTIKDVVRARILGMIPWKNIRENRCKFKNLEGYRNIKAFLATQEKDDLHLYYSRTKRPAHKYPFLVWFEKETVEPEFESVCRKYNVPWLNGRGQPTWTAKHDMAIKIMDWNWKILYFGDNDEKGHEIYDVIKRDLKYQKCKPRMKWCMMTDKIEKKYDLPPNARLDGLELDELKIEIEKVIRKHIDIPHYETILRIEKKEKEELKNYKLVLQKK